MADNRLANSTSPYLLQHQHNPVDWRPWGQEALQEAKSLDKPILLSIGYAACHWCHVMAHESFEDKHTADVMNRLFVNIKVDREERPDIDQIYMSALHALGEQGGWPLTMFLTPGGHPFWGGTYFPKEARWGRPSFVEVLNAVNNAYTSDKHRIEANRAALMGSLVKASDKSGDIQPALLEQAAARLQGLMDPINGGIKGAPKFPQAAILELLWRMSIRAGSESFRHSVLQTLERMSLGGIYDHIGGGLCRYSTDERWLVPHFEKMLYDNGQYLIQLIWAYKATGAELFRSRIEETANWLIRDMQTSDGGFASSFDADSEGEEGKFYLWSPGEVINCLGPEEGKLFNQLYGIIDPGNFDGSNIPNLLDALDPSASLAPSIRRHLQKLQDIRSHRIAPAQDDKILADWNGIAIEALAYGAESVSRESWRESAIMAYRFILDRMRDNTGRLAHAYRNGQVTRPAFASDYAWMMRAAIALAETEPARHLRNNYLSDAETLALVLEADYLHPDGGYYLTSSQADDLIIRPISGEDDAIANYNAIAASAYIRLWHHTGKNEYRDIADRILSAFAGSIPKNIFGGASMMSAFDCRWNTRLTIIVVPEGADASAMQERLSAAADPSLIRIVCESTVDLPASHPAFGKTALNGAATLYLCKEGRCSPPIIFAEEIERALIETGAP